MPRFFVRAEQLKGDIFSIYGEDAHHISRSLRMASGEHITVCDMQGKQYECELCEFLDGEVRARVLSCEASDNEPPCRIYLYQALPKGDKLDTIIQKAVECGVWSIIPFESERCITRIKSDAEKKKQERRSRIAYEAAKQCGRSVIPAVELSISFDKMINEASAHELCLFCYEGDNTEPIGRVLEKSIDKERGVFPKSIAVIIGSEGGFSQNEAQKCKDAGMLPVGLGKRILRTETTTGFVLACIACFSELL